MTSKSDKARVRAAKACRRCSQRKIKCDAVQNGFPCSRCRMDEVDDCTLILSRRGTYDRNAARDLRLKQHQAATARVRDGGAGARPSAPDHDTHGRAEHSPAEQASPPPPPPPPPVENSAQTTFSPIGSVSSSQSIGASSAGSGGRSISAMFEDFLSWRDKRSEGRLGLILLGEPSPLTFALEELPQDSHPQLHDASSQICSSANLEVIQNDIHPPHLDAADIAYLKAKGAFTCPSEKTLDDLVAAYLTHFHPLYSIVNKVELDKVHRERKLPWILLHAVCFVGATFCDPYILHSCQFPSRVDARRHFYQKAKLLFDTSYETNKIILLQVAIMLSFWGPQMQSYWNPSSWIGFGVTFAVSLGIHRSTPSSNAPGGDRGLLRRLWWTLVVRDTYCAVLLGRPFRIDLPHADTGMLTPDDFVYENYDQGFYQIQLARLSQILRAITRCRLGDRKLHPHAVHAQIEAWRADLDVSLHSTWPPAAGSPPLMCSSALEILYHYCRMLLYIDKPGLLSLNPGTERERESERGRPPSSHSLVESAALAISSKAITLMTKTRLPHLPHELFPGFFVAGIVHYRQTHRADDMIVAQMARASLDNCRVVLNEARECWEPGRWALEIFDFLSTNHSNDADADVDPNASVQRSVAGVAEQALEDSALASNFLFASSWDSVLQGGLADDALLMPSFLPSVADEWSYLQPSI
ncbi:fungal-specific transcription factor domain-containing protein [Aspergillus insuetus]